ncbi:MAG: sugar ABC transporter permease [Chloroflexi bacterium]|nr:sugar ABC transporter permease [Chloroflexota bacterium]
MVGWSGTRKTLTILAFIVPTLLGIMVFSLYPIFFNIYISFTNRNQFRPNPNCQNTLTAIFEPSCWAWAGNEAPQGIGEPFAINDPLFRNYIDLLGDLFSPEALLSLLVIGLVLAPFFVAQAVNQRFGKEISRPVDPGWVWLGAIVLAAGLGLALNLPNAVGRLFDTGDFIVVMIRTTLYVILNVPLFFLVGLMLALILNSDYIKGRTVFRVLSVVPWAASTVAVMMSLVWQFFFREQGTVNQLLGIFGVEAFAWLNNDVTAFAVTVIANVWYSYPFMMLVILGALQSIPPDQYEAADVDGATFWDKLMNITLPLIRPAILPAVVLTSITTFQMFGTVWAITRGGPTRGALEPGATEFVMIHAYKQVFETQAYGRMGAFAVITFILLFSATLYSLRITRITSGAYDD